MRRSARNTTRERVGSALTVVGIAAALPSAWQTVTHITDDTYRAPQARHGEGHVQYHMARETMVTAGALATVGLGLAAGPERGVNAWRGMAAAAAGFVAAMWSGGPATGVWAPNRGALLIHTVSSAGLAAGVWTLRPRSGR